MHIKTLRIQGFKSYRDQTAVEEFSPGHNVVVGRNGSGKSNFFAAIRFVLSDAYTSMSREERQALLHDSSASVSATLSAFVEIVFDNSDGRFPYGSNSELTLRRTIGVKKDEYTLDGKSVTKRDVINMLEAAGFSRSNPYYIVPQGRIARLTNMKDVDRLNLLKEIAGANVYVDRRAASLQILEETKFSTERVETSLQELIDRQADLDKERKELKEYLTKDKERRGLEYALSYKELQDVLGSMEDLEARKKEDAGRMEIASKMFWEKDAVLLTMTEKLSNLIAQMQMQTRERDALVQERGDLARKQAQLESEINDDEERAEQTGLTRPELEAKARELDERIAVVEGDLMGHIPLLADKAKDLADKRAQLDDTNAKVGLMFAKEARSNQFQNQAQRDAALQGELQSLGEYETLQRRSREEVQEEAMQVEARVKAIEETVTQKEEAMEQRKKFIEERSAKWDELKKQEDHLTEKKKLLWKEEEKLRGSSSIAKEKLDTAVKQLASMMDRSTSRGLAAVEEITKRLSLPGVFGPLYKLFTVVDMYKTAVEVTAGQSLFHVVVDTDETASRLLQVMNQESSGRVTFIPLNRIKPQTVAFQENTDAILMINKVRFEPRYKLAMDQVFGRTIVCPTLEIASSYVKSHGVNGITLDGDRVERKGALTGGFHNPRNSRLDTVQKIATWQALYHSEASRLEEIRGEVLNLDQRITVLTGEKQQLENRSHRIMQSRHLIQSELQSMREEESQCQEKLQRLRLAQEQIERELSTCALKKRALEEELKSPLRRGLQAEEEATLKTLTLSIDQQEKEVAQLVKRVMELTNERTMMEIELNGSLKNAREVITTQLEMMEEGTTFSQDMASMGEGGGGGNAQSSSARKKQLGVAKKQLRECQKALDRLEQQVESTEAETKEVQEEVDRMTRVQAEEARKLEKHEKVVTRVMAKTRELANRRSDAERKIRELGVIPGESYNKYTSQTAESILKKLHAINAALKKYSNVNKRAVEQYEGFTKLRDELLDRRAELEKSKESIEGLVVKFDMQKDEAIERTFKQVQKNFAEIFERLVPVGRGSLAIEKRADLNAEGGADSSEGEEDDDDDDDDDEEEEEGDDDGDVAMKRAKVKTANVENYIGVLIKVSFNSKVDEGLQIQQLSGGQKSLVALALVFAIQKCDSAPFYLFDEIDANLDAQYRTAVASLIQELSAEAQFITTTFRPELVGVGGKHYGVLFNAQKVSSLQPITQDDAYEFVEASSQPL
ncbi:hypothetical protein CBS101457_001118 [Exobasidium rhododendri]|nr:hypothetical protein CBS101457_001118 [Exobasidium rhododendri]